MLPSDRRCMGESCVGRGFAVPAQMGDGFGHAGRVPMDDGGDDEVAAGGSVKLSFMAAVESTATWKGPCWSETWV